MPQPGLYLTPGAQQMPSIPSGGGSYVPQNQTTPTITGTIQVTMEEGLVASIVDQSLNEVNDTILSVNRTRN
jgi:hypothetical protein